MKEPSPPKPPQPPELPADAEIRERHPDGSPAMVALTSGAAIDAVPCLEGTAVHLHPNGRVAQATIAGPWMPGDLAFEKGDLVTFRADATVERVALGRSRPFAGVPGADVVSFGADGSVERVTIGDRSFDGEGRLRARTLHDPEVIAGLPCAAGAVKLHANGRVEQAVLAGPLASPHGVIPKGTIAFLDDSGRLVRAMLREPCTLATHPFGAGTTVRFDADGPHVDEAFIFFE